MSEVKEGWNISIRLKLFLFGAVLATASLIIFGSIEYRNAKSAINDLTFAQLTAVREMKAQQIEDYFELISNQIRSVSTNEEAHNAIKGFKLAIAALKSSNEARLPEAMAVSEGMRRYYEDEFFERLQAHTLEDLKGVSAESYFPNTEVGRYLQEQYIVQNPNPTGEKHVLTDAGDGTYYSSMHSKYHPWFRDYLDRFGFYDIFLVEPEDGQIVYSVFKEVDFGTSLLTGPYQRSNFAEVFKAAREWGLEAEVNPELAAGQVFVKLADFEPYEPSYNAPASFIAAPIMNQGKLTGVLVFQMPIGRINEIMTSNQAWSDVGLGESGETYLVGSDFLMRNQSRFLIEDAENYFAMIKNIGTAPETIQQIRAFESSIGLQRVETQGTRRALAGETDTEIFPDYRGVPVLSSYRPINSEGINWVIMSEIDEAEAFAPVTDLRDRMFLLLILFALLVGAISAVLSKRITSPIKELTQKAAIMAEGDLGVKIDTSGGDEIAKLARSFDVMRDALADLIGGLEQKVAERTESLEASETRIRTIFENAADGIIVIGTDGVIQEFSHSAEKIFGYDRGEVVGGKVDVLMPEPMQSEHDSYLQRYVKSGDPRVIGRTREVIGLRKNGSEFPMGLTVGEAFVGGERIFVGIVRDITARREAEQEMSEVYQIIEQMPMNVFVQSEDMRFKYVNRAFEKFHGVKRENILGEKVRDIFPEEGKAYEGYNRDILATGRRRDAETLVKDHTGQDYHLQVSTFPIKDAEGNHVAVAGLDIDITERKQNAKKLADNLAFISALVDAIPNPLFVKDPEARFLTFNEAYNNVFGSTAKEKYIGKTLLDMEHPSEEKRRFHHEEDVELIKDGGTKHSEISVTLLDGSERQMLYWAKAFDLSDGSRGGMLGVVVDITHQKELEKQLSIANKRMGDELNIGREIQMSMIPLTFPRFPEHRDIDVWATLRPAREVGGDFYDFFFINERKFAFVVADVSGKGVPAALLMAVTKTLLKSHSQSTMSTARIIQKTNNELSENNKDCMFITVFFGIIDTETGEMTYTNAGHNPPYILSPTGELKTLDEIHGPMIGVMENIQYEEATIKLGMDDKIIVFTDGITEAFNNKSEAYGEKRLEQLLSVSNKHGVKYLMHEIVDSVDEFAGEAEQSDDITVFGLRYVDWESREERAVIELHLKNELSEIDRCQRALEEFGEKFGLEAEVQNALSIVLDDFLNNIISYAFQDEEEHIIDVSLETDKQRLIVSVEDDGIEFDPFMQDDPDTESSLEDRKIGGLGIHLMKNLMDDYSYRRKNGRNITVMMKRMGD